MFASPVAGTETLPSDGRSAAAGNERTVPVKSSDVQTSTVTDAEEAPVPKSVTSTEKTAFVTPVSVTEIVPTGASGLKSVKTAVSTESSAWPPLFVATARRYTVLLTLGSWTVPKPEPILSVATVFVVVSAFGE